MTTTVELVYVGARLHKGKLVFAYVEAKGDTLGETAHMYPSPLDQYEVGSHSQYRGPSKRELTPGAIKTFGQWPDAEVTRRWVVTHNAEMAGHKATLANPPEGLHDIVAPIREVYMRADDKTRAIILAQVAAAIVTEP